VEYSIAVLLFSIIWEASMPSEL